MRIDNDSAAEEPPLNLPPFHASSSRNRNISLIFTLAALVMIVAGPAIDSSLELTTRLVEVSWAIPIYSLGLGLLVIAGAIGLFYAPEQRLLQGFQTVVLIVGLWLIPMTVTLYPEYGVTSVQYESFSTAIFGSGHLTLTGDFWQQNWPGMWILGAVSLLVTGTSHSSSTMVSIAKYIPVAWIGAYSLFAFLIFKAYLPKRLTWTALWLFIFGNWVGLNNFDIESLAIFLFYCLLFTLLARPMKHSRIIILILVTALSIDHPLTALFSAVAVLALYRGKGKKSLFAMTALIVIGWEVFGAIIFWGSQLSTRLALLVNSISFFDRNLSAPLASGSLTYQLGLKLEVIYGAIAVLLSFLGFLLLTRKKGVDIPVKVTKSIFLSVVLVTSVGFVLSGSFGFETVERIYVVLLPLLTLMTVAGLGTKKTLVLLIVLLMLLGIPTNVIGDYGLTGAHYLPSFEKGSIYFTTFTTHGFYSNMVTTFSTDPTNYTQVTLLGACYCNLSTPNLNLVHPYFVSMNNVIRVNLAYTFGNNSGFSSVSRFLVAASQADLVYNNADFVLFVNS